MIEIDSKLGASVLPFNSTKLDACVSFFVNRDDLLGRPETIRNILSYIRRGEFPDARFTASALLTHYEETFLDEVPSDNIEKASGLMALTFSEPNSKKIKHELSTDPHVLAAYIVQDYLTVIIQIDENNRQHSFNTAQSYFLDNYFLRARLCPSIDELSPLSFDPDLIIKSRAIAFSPSTNNEGDRKTFVEIQSHLPKRYSLNANGNADIFHDLYGADYKFSTDTKAWLKFDKKTGWNTVPPEVLLEKTGELSRELLNRVAKLPATTNEEVAIKKSETSRALKIGEIRPAEDLLKRFGSLNEVRVTDSDFDTSPNVIGAQTSFVNIFTGKIREYRRSDLLTRKLGCNAEATAKCPRWEKFIREIFPNEDVRHYIQKYCGYTFSGSMKDQSFIFLHGRGANGKSTFLEVLQEVFGQYASPAGSKLLYVTKDGTPDNQIADLNGVRLIVGAESEKGASLNEAALKRITGADKLSGRRLHENTFQFKPVGKLWLAGNYKPVIKGDVAIWRRVRLIPFERQFLEGERDENLMEALRSELPGILNWILAGAKLWLSEGLIPPDVVKCAINEYRDDEDFLLEFLERYTVTGDHSFSLKHKDLYDQFRLWADGNGVSHKMTSRSLVKALKERGWKSVRTKEDWNLWSGYKLVTKNSAQDESVDF